MWTPHGWSGSFSGSLRRKGHGSLFEKRLPCFSALMANEALPPIFRWGPVPRRVEIRFAAKGESFLPAALASMASKYLRELAMTAFNAFWIRQVPGLRPTAGYPVDALRFKADIASRQQQLGISDDVLWRVR